MQYNTYTERIYYHLLFYLSLFLTHTLLLYEHKITMEALLGCNNVYKILQRQQLR